jgi:hypothetical protein
MAFLKHAVNKNSLQILSTGRLSKILLSALVIFTAAPVAGVEPPTPSTWGDANGLATDWEVERATGYTETESTHHTTKGEKWLAD